MTMPGTPVFLSYGLGLESTAILMRWLNDPASRDFPLSDLTVMTAMTGDEWPITGHLVSRYVLPMLRAHSVRYVQVARAGPTQAHGVAVLDDSASPTTLHLDGAYTLAEEMLSAGTIPQSGGARKCSQKAKGWPQDTIRHQIADGRPYRHVIGYNLHETGRAATDATHTHGGQRTGEYPLINEWAWGREECDRYIFDLVGVHWPKSACTYCPFSLQSREGTARTLPRFAAEPEAGSLALLMEHVATALNPAQGLIGGKLLADRLRGAEYDQTRQALRERMDAQPYAVYEVRRALLPRKADATKRGTATRLIQAVAAGTEAQMLAELESLADQHGTAVEISARDGHARVWLERRDPDGPLPQVEWLYALAPGVVADKVGPGFAKAWALAAPVATARKKGVQPVLF